MTDPDCTKDSLKKEKCGDSSEAAAVKSSLELSTEQRKFLNDMDRPLAEYVEFLRAANEAGIKLSDLSYALELLKRIKDKNFYEFKWLAAVEVNREETAPQDIINKVLDIFINIVHVNRNGALSPANLNRIISQLVNIDSLSKLLKGSDINSAEKLCSYLKLRALDRLTPGQRKLMGQIEKPIGEFAEVLWQIDKSDIEISKVLYSIELLKSVILRDYNKFDWLAAVESQRQDYEPKAALKRVLSIFENLLDVNQLNGSEPTVVNRIMSQLTNINRICQTIDRKKINNIKYQIEKMHNEALSNEHIRSVCYSQEGEDLILARLFPDSTTGFYVDIGAHHPTRFSNTYLLYLRKWRGINIDPLPGCMELFDKLRPRDINLEIAISADIKANGSVKYVQFEEPAYNYILTEYSKDVEIGDINSTLVTIADVPTRRLDDILEENAEYFDKINLLNIDVELNEMEVLKSFSIDKYLPEIVIVEIKNMSLDRIKHNFVYQYFVDKGYRLKSLLFNSVIFELRK